MRISKDLLVRFLEGVMVGGDIVNNEALITFSKDKISTLVINDERTVVLKGEVTGEFEDLGSLGIDNIEILINSLNNFGAEVDISLKDNKLVIAEDGLKASLILRSIEYIKNSIEETKFNSFKDKALGNEIGLTEETKSKIKKYFVSLKSSYILLEGKNNVFGIKVDKDDNTIEANFGEGKIKENFIIKLGKIFIDIISSTTGTISCSFKNDNPIWLKSTNDNITFEYIIAPIKQ